MILANVKIFEYWQWRAAQIQKFENGPVAFVMLENGFKRGVIEVQVFNTDGKPEVGVEVVIRNNSGPNVGVTDASGRVDIDVAEHDVDQIRINGQTVLDRPNAASYGFPSINPGLRVLILHKVPTKQ